MNDKQYKNTVATIERIVKRWLPRLGLDRWNITVSYEEDELPASVDSVTNADVWCKWEYRRASIRFNVYSLYEEKPLAIERTVIHELCHIMVCGMRQTERTTEFTEKEEHTVAGLTEAFMRTYKSAYEKIIKDVEKKVKADRKSK